MRAGPIQQQVVDDRQGKEIVQNLGADLTGSCRGQVAKRLERLHQVERSGQHPGEDVARAALAVFVGQ